ncbi:cell morphogenesis C-terminal-domain-containing protein [Jimgerdemannia flammicorona]|uniref:Cell morphogenesis C-terminal-domain-containing protein n=1 Tax=Jimgerdemannia flammicorona TaxID=994334 RepID=A0A433QID9_9FUNG|nr:cell morphogenesis C-terminal-domain-containing protein [Jimgerdemannia flammicorona]
MRHIALGCVSRLLWVYLYRCTEGNAATVKRLDSVVKTLYPSTRRSVNPMDTPLDHFVLIAYITLMRHQEYAMKSLIYYLLSAEFLIPYQLNNVPLELLAPERMTIAIRAYMLMLADLEKSDQRPSFPISTDMTVTGIPMTISADLLTEKVLGRNPVRDTLEKMNEIIAKILMALDQSYGSLIVFDEKNITRHLSFAVPSTAGPSAPPLVLDSSLVTHHYASFSVSYMKERQPYFDLLRTIINAMPRLMPTGLPLPKVVEILSRYTVHVDPEVARAASEALIRIAMQVDAVIPVTGFARYIQRFEDRFEDVVTSLANGPTTGVNHHGNGGAMKLYVTLLTIWVDQVDINALARPDEESDGDTVRTHGSKEAEVKAIWEIIEDTEANGVLFLCSHMSWVRRYAVQILKLAAFFEKRIEQQFKSGGQLDRPQSLISQLTSHIINRDHTRVYQLLEQVGPDLVKLDKETNMLVGQRIGSVERIRIMQHQRRGAKDVILQLASSDHASDIKIWNILFPELIKMFLESFPQTVTACRSHICNRLIQIQPALQAAIDVAKSNPNSTLSMSKVNSNKTVAATDDLVMQWRIYVTFACATITLNDNLLTTNTLSGGIRKRSAGSDKLTTAKELFKLIVPYITCDHSLICESAVLGLGRTNRNSYKVLMEDFLRPYVWAILEDTKQRANQKPYQMKRNRKYDRLRTEVMHIYQLTADCLVREVYLRDEELMDMIMIYVKETKSFLLDAEVQGEWFFHKLRRFFCGLIERLYENLSRLEDPTKIMSFETRLNLFKMFEQWCGYGQQSKEMRDREARMVTECLDMLKDTKERSSMIASMEEERKALETAALSAMAALCRGPVMAYMGRDKARQNVIQFDIMNLLSWIDAVFASKDSKLHVIARFVHFYCLHELRALEAILIYNQNQPALLDDVIEQCYAGNPKLEFTQGYFLALADIVTRVDDYPHKFHQIMCLALFKAGDPKKLVRQQAIQLLRVVEEHIVRDSCAKDYEIGIMSTLPIIYKQTQILLSLRLAQDHQNMSDPMLSEMTQRFENISPNYQREVLGYMLPWIRNADLSVGPQDTELSPSAFMLLSNIFFLTIKYGDVYVKEIEALWVHLLADHVRNVRAIRVIEEVVAEIKPRSMVPQVKEESNRHATAFPYLFVADIDKVLPPFPKRPIFSRGQLAVMFLVDLTVEAGLELAPHLPLMLHTIFVQLDHQINLICEQVRCLLINLVHSIIIRQGISPVASQSGNALVALLSAKEGKRFWSYEDMSYKNRNIVSATELQSLAKAVVDAFSYAEPDIRQKWGEVALQLATSCPVRHIACRSFQIFRALMPDFNQHMLGDMLARLSNTISDKSEDVRGFALEILVTLNAVADALEPHEMEQFPLIFWAALACMYSPHEFEYFEGLSLLDKFLNKFNVKVASNHTALMSSLPKDWATEFVGLQPLLLKGLLRASAEAITVSLIRSTTSIDDPKLIDPTETRLLFLLLGAMPNLLHGLEGDVVDLECITWAEELARVFEQYSMPDLQRILSSYSRQKFRTQQDFLRQLVIAMRDEFFPQFGQEAVVFTLALLSNKLPHYRTKSLAILKIMLPYINAKLPGDLGLPVEMINPLLQLLYTEYAENALSVLDEVISVTVGNTGFEQTSDGYKPGAQNNGDVATVEPVWGTVNPVVAAKMTRQKIQAVVYQCASNGSSGKPGTKEDLFTTLEGLNDYYDEMTMVSVLDDLGDDGFISHLDDDSIDGPDGPDGPDEPDGPDGPDEPDGPDGPSDPSSMQMNIPRIDFSYEPADPTFPHHYASNPSFFPNAMIQSEPPQIDYSNQILAHHLKKAASGRSLKTAYYIDSFESASLDVPISPGSGLNSRKGPSLDNSTRISFETMETGDTMETESTDSAGSEGSDGKTTSVVERETQDSNFL